MEEGKVEGPSKVKQKGKEEEEGEQEDDKCLFTPRPKSPAFKVG